MNTQSGANPSAVDKPEAEAAGAELTHAAMSAQFDAEHLGGAQAKAAAKRAKNAKRMRAARRAAKKNQSPARKGRGKKRSAPKKAKPAAKKKEAKYKKALHNSITLKPGHAAIIEKHGVVVEFKKSERSKAQGVSLSLPVWAELDKIAKLAGRKMQRNPKRMRSALVEEAVRSYLGMKVLSVIEW